MKIEEGDLLVPPYVVRKTFDWWSERKTYEVVNHGGVVGVWSDDGDFYDEDSLYSNNYLKEYHEYSFTVIKNRISLENE